MITTIGNIMRKNVETIEELVSIQEASQENERQECKFVDSS